jgi:hypothetical protein
VKDLAGNDRRRVTHWHWATKKPGSGLLSPTTKLGSWALKGHHHPQLFRKNFGGKLRSLKCGLHGMTKVDAEESRRMIYTPPFAHEELLTSSSKLLYARFWNIVLTTINTGDWCPESEQR